MANAKKNKIPNGEMKFDSSLDFNFEGGFDLDDTSRQKRKRHPIHDVVRGVGAGVKAKVKNISFWDHIARTALPGTYAMISDEVQETHKVMSETWRDTVKILKPDMQRIGRQVDALVPEETKLLKQLTAKANPKQPYMGPSAEQLKEEGISQAVGDVFGKTSDQDIAKEARSRAEQRIRDSVSAKRFEGQIGVLGNIASNLAKMSAYTTTVNAAFQKRSLELQYRSYHVHVEQLRNQVHFNDVFKAYLEAIKENTALPDYVKLTGVERAKQAMLNSLFTGMSSSLSGGAKRLRKKILSNVRGLGDQLSTLSFGLDALESVRDQMKMAKEMGMDESLFYHGASYAGAGATNYLGNKLGDWTAKNINPSGRFAKFVGSAARAVRNPTNLINKIQGQDKYQQYQQRDGIIGFLARALDSGLNEFKTPATETKIRDSGELSLAKVQPYYFSNRAHQSLTEVIPTLLSRILQETTAIRMGEKALGPQLSYDWGRRTFTTARGRAGHLGKELLKASGASTVNYRLDNYVKGLAGKDLDETSHTNIKRFLSTVGQKYKQLDINSDDLFRTREFELLSPSEQAALRKQLAEQGSTEQGQAFRTHLFSSIHEDQTVMMAQARRAMYEMLEDDTQARELLKAGFVTRKAGVYHVVESRLMDFIRRKGLGKRGKEPIKKAGWARDESMPRGGKSNPEDPFKNLRPDHGPKKKSDILTTPIPKPGEEQPPGNSDRNIKTNISSTQPGEWLKRMQATKTYRWRYRHGMGTDDHMHHGYMAQEVRRQFGDKAAPGGTMVDYGYMTSANSAAIKDLAHEHQKSVKDPTAIELLRSIDQRLSEMSTIGKIGIGLPTTSDMKAVYGRGMEYARTVKSKVQKAMTKENLAGTLTKGYQYGQTVKAKVTATTASAKEWMKMPHDLHIPGMDQPVILADLLTKGFYATKDGKPIMTMDQLRKAAEGVYTRAGDQVVNAQQMVQGLYDRNNKKIIALKAKVGAKVKTLKEQAAHTLEQAHAAVPGVYSAGAAGVASALNNAANYMQSGGGGMGVLSGIKNFVTGGGLRGALSKTSSLGSKFFTGTSGGKRLASLGNRLGATKIGGLIGRAGGRVGGLLSTGLSMLDGGPDADHTQDPNAAAQQSQQNQQSNRTNSLLSRLGGMISQLPSAIRSQATETGERVGNYRDRLKQKAEEDAQKKADRGEQHPDDIQTPRYSGSGSNPLSMLGGFLGFLGTATSGIFNLVKGITKFMFKGGAGIKGLVTGPAKILGAAGSVGAKILGATGKVGGAVGSVLGVGGRILGATTGILGKIGAPLARVGGRFALGTAGRILTGTVARTALFAGADAVLTGGLGGIALAGISAGLSLLGAALSSPVILGALAVGAVAYGGYKLFKYLTRDKLDDYQKFRFMQYGFGTKATESYNHKLANLENILLPYVAYASMGNSVYRALLKKVSSEDQTQMLKIFEIDPERQHWVNEFSLWIEHRFKPFFLNTLTSMANVNRKAKLDELKKLTAEERVTFLKAARFDGGPYDYNESPVEDLDSLPSNKQEVLSMVDTMTKKAQQEVDKSNHGSNRNASLEAGDLKKQSDQLTAAKKKAEEDAKNKLIQAAKDNAAKVEQAAYLRKNAAWNNKLSGNTTASKTPGVISPEAETKPSGGLTAKAGVNSPLSAFSAMGSAGSTPGKLNVAPGAIVDGSGAKQFIKTQSGVNLQGVNPQLLKNFFGMVQEYGKPITINSAYRTFDQQQAEFHKASGGAAYPGKSMHNFGLALDVHSSDLDAMEKAGLMRKYGFTRPIGGEPWHTEPAGIQQNLGLAQSSPEAAAAMVMSSLGRGGGGAALDGKTGKLHRNPSLQLALFNASSGTVSGQTDAKTGSVGANTASPMSPMSPMGSSGISRPPAANDARHNPSVVGMFGRSVAPPTPARNMPGGAPATAMPGMGPGAGRSFTSNGKMPLEQAPVESTEQESKPSGETGRAAKAFPVDRQGILATIAEGARKVGVDPTSMQVIGAVESGLRGNAAASTSSAKGTFQYIDASWRGAMRRNGRKYGLSGDERPENTAASSILASIDFKENIASLKRVVPNAGLTEGYIAHFLGAGGAHAFFSAPAEANAVAMFPGPASVRGNRPIFFNGSKPRTIGEVYTFIANRLATAAKQYGISGANINKQFPGKGGKSGAMTAATSDMGMAASTGGSASTSTMTATGGGAMTPSASTSMGGSSTTLSSMGSSTGRPASSQQMAPMAAKMPTMPMPSDASSGSSPVKDRGPSPISDLTGLTSKSLEIQKKQLDVMIEIRDEMKQFVSTMTDFVNNKGGGSKDQPSQPSAQSRSSSTINPILDTSRTRTMQAA